MLSAEGNTKNKCYIVSRVMADDILLYGQEYIADIAVCNRVRAVSDKHSVTIS